MPHGVKLKYFYYIIFIYFPVQYAILCFKRHEGKEKKREKQGKGYFQLKIKITYLDGLVDMGFEPWLADLYDQALRRIWA